MIGVGLRAAYHLARGGASAPVGGSAQPAVLPVTPSARWHPGFSAPVISNGRVTHATDLRGLADVTEGASGAGPLAMTDALGKPFWRFEGHEFLNVAASLVADSRDISVFMVGRVPRHPAESNRYLSLGNRAQASQVNTLGGPLDSRIYANSVGHMQSFGRVAYTAPAGAQWLVPGAQLQVMGAATAQASSRLFLNDHFVDVAPAYERIGISGGEIGRYAWSPRASGQWGLFDLYEMVVFAPGLSQADALAVNTALMQAHNIAPVTNQLVLEGDSIMYGTGNVTPHLSAAALLSAPGTGLLPAGWRVVNKALSGHRISHLVTKRDATHGWATQTLPGRNVLAFEIGRNDWANSTAAQHYTNVVAYLAQSGTGVLPRGWEARVMANIATGAGYMAQVEAYRAALRDPQFLTDIGASGQVSVISTDLIEHAGQRRFETATQATDTTYYAGDNTHPSVLGAQIRITGGQTPQHGILAGL